MSGNMKWKFKVCRRTYIKYRFNCREPCETVSLLFSNIWASDAYIKNMFKFDSAILASILFKITKKRFLNTNYLKVYSDEN
jgi:hypothetical protein